MTTRLPHSPLSLRARAATHILLIAASVAAISLAACSSKAPREVKASDAPVARDVPEFLRGTIGSETILRGSEPILVSGLGLVVGLNGTGGGELPPNIATTMERELALNGVGKGGPAGGQMEGVTPQEFLRSKNVAVVIVEARLSPGSPEGSPFDVFVRTLPGSSVTSLEGGRLWSTDLRIGPAAVFTAMKTRKLAEAHGPVYINPFSDTLGGANADDIDTSSVSLTRTMGRVLHGGKVTDPLKLEIVLDNPSHSRARSMVSSINTRFPGEAAGRSRGPVARGRAGDSIALQIPTEYAERPEEFIQIVRYLRIDPTFSEAAAAGYVRALKERPANADQLMWCITAIGESARKFLVSMYDYSELAPRMAALEAGARLEDPRTVAPLVEVARTAPQTPMRLTAIELLARMRGNPNINFALRELVDDPALEVRIAAYEALSELRDPAIDRSVVPSPDPRQPLFVLEQVPSSTPMIYVTQQGEPRIAIFGGQKFNAGGRAEGTPLKLSRPTLVSMWSDRLFINADAIGAVRVRFKDDRKNSVVETPAPEHLTDFIKFLARRTTPEDPRPGLNLGFSEVVGVLYELTKQRALAAAFATEEDKLRAEVYAAASNSVLSDRPEDSERAEDLAVQVFRPMPAQNAGASAGSTEKTSTTRRSKIVPLAKPVQK